MPFKVWLAGSSELFIKRDKNLVVMYETKLFSMSKYWFALV